MKCLPRPSQLIKYSSTIAATSVLLILLTPVVQGQVDPQGRRDPNRPLTDAERQRKLDRDLEDRERDMRMIDRVARADEGPGPGIRRRVLVADIQKAGEQLQDTNVKLQQTIQSSGAPDYGRIAGYASEIRKIADRLQSDLALPKAEPQGEREKRQMQQENDQSPTDEQLRTSIKTLDLAIKSFLSNEILQRPGAIDAQLFEKAAQDISGTLRQSARIKKLADALRKSEAKPGAASAQPTSSATTP